ncbi:hypothetical protein [Methanobrevibacter sp. DSM 116169]|uniref:hypothetical protein n=1 Tax=Methanobrevibacter sp. DSM 116169 TaxID=3242727 RepID=UPI0038FCDD2B
MINKITKEYVKKFNKSKDTQLKITTNKNEYLIQKDDKIHFNNKESNIIVDSNKTKILNKDIITIKPEYILNSNELFESLYC